MSTSALGAIAGGGGRFEVLGRRGRLRVVRQPPIEALGAGPFRRLLALLARS